jgi:hypothetical protein
MQRISAALTTLQSDLPVLIDDTRRLTPQDELSLTILGALLDSVNKSAPGFQKFRRHGPGRKPEAWHQIARNLRTPILAALTASGVKRAGFAKSTSPAVMIVRSALGYLGVTASHEAIVDAMRTRKRKAGNIAA